MSAPASYYELYRNSSIGTTLTSTLDELQSSGMMTPQLGALVLRHFDRHMAEGLASVRAVMKLKGDLVTYRNVDDVWMFQLKDITFTFEKKNQVQVKKINVVAMAVRD
ncbi:transcription initiation factor IIA, gamma subunit [Tricharina praecox]|uniref:transcription initiation factor IIA, gamma subunit n=1 Tax=Tricharina praecox TaxID=43433 RepID=UPI00221E7A57|nr:transcription initiation factor IIA, gamma subunit [Tricharina praecox]KAI5847530.1 transcription initiation factor IIA, gamma subunit [Tricharina praecox]